MNKKDNLIVNLSFDFALEIIEFSELLETKRKFNMANQLFRCGTSIGANVWEAQDAESKNDFIHKLKISAKEASETEFWLQLCMKAKNYPDSSALIEKLISIQKVVAKIIVTSKAKSVSSKKTFIRKKSRKIAKRK